MWNSYIVLIIKWTAIVCLIKGITCIKLVSLNVPNRVRKGSEVELSCLYDLGNASLYSLKWFYRESHRERDEQEFFRYTPRGKPVKQIFPLDGINVDLNKSEGGTVTISGTNVRTTGNYKCEISVEGTFQTVFAEKLMTVDASRASQLWSGVMDTNKLSLIMVCVGYSLHRWQSWAPVVHSSLVFIISLTFLALLSSALALQTPIIQLFNTLYVRIRYQSLDIT